MKAFNILVNGLWRRVVTEPSRAHLDVLREDLRLTGAKQSCDRKGQCGACTVIVNGEAVKSCLKKMDDLGQPSSPPTSMWRVHWKSPW